MNTTMMPKLQPLPILTKGLGFFAKLWVWRSSARKWRIAEDWHFQLPNELEIIIPKNFQFDGASIPRFLWSLLSPTGLLLIPGLIHDFAYRFDYLWITNTDGHLYRYNFGMGRKFWDILFYEVGKSVNGMSWINVQAYLAVRLFGFIAWNSNRRLNSKELRPLNGRSKE